MRKLDLSQLNAFRVLVTERSVTRAADRLGMSQPAMSAILRSLRSEFADPLLIRAPGGSTPTPRALELMGTVNEILDRVESLSESKLTRQRVSDIRQRVSLAASDYVQQFALAPLLNRIQAEAPGIHLQIRLADNSRLRAWMESGEVDLGIAPAVVPTGRLHFVPACRDRAVVIMNERLAGNFQRLTLPRFCSLPHVRVAPNMRTSTSHAFFDEATDRELKKRGLNRRIVLTVQNFSAVPQLVSQASVVATVPSRLVAHVGRETPIFSRDPLVPLPEMVIGLFWHERTHKSEFQRWFRELVRNTLQSI